MNSPWLMDIFSLADRLGEADPRKIASLPADIILYWKAWHSLTGSTVKGVLPAGTVMADQISDDLSGQCADVMRILGQ
ncbi:hypothetical protein AB4D51_004569 [Salmonella enterica]|uniref:Uncharacterized protein n=1 Tax=Salmonella enterica I TaxID=59201 RepID=A0A7Z1T4K8_SALET|nr:hypothetical protein [Salmonella enterica]ECE6850124.1 hypothetical protein [Salmonella enterica subsp. diarizonae]ECF5991367.1 hypothetical protein [Salmonella enterica subsp. houtenae]EDF5839563.1 hypothetical protein [Salmonella enterica subsp. enterica serovar Enteritidis]EDL3398730.1 hypothetical protein [Salmonella enterica subsp. enterica serovar Typhimurium]EDT9767081.1 hypothetical protein [Salmonella enterica subsp. enterica serovar Falkensee]EDV7733024.1 hypothetical protein [Sa